MESSTAFYKDKLVLVTGGTGFVGRHLVDRLLSASARIRIPIHERQLDRQDARIETLPADLTLKEDCLRATRDVDYLFHAAGAVSAAGVTATNPMSAITTNLVLTARILEAAWTNGVKRCLIFGSSTGYPATDHPVREDEMWSGPPHSVYFGYGWMRRYLELISQFVAQKSSTKIALVRPTAVYGRYDNFDLATSHFIPALIRKAVDRVHPYEVWGTGEEIRDLLHISDLARGCLIMMEKHACCDPINIGYGKPIQVKEVIRIILDAAGYGDAKLVFNSDRPSTIPVRMVDCSRAAEILGFTPAISIEEGLKDTIDWYRRTLVREG